MTSSRIRLAAGLGLAAAATLLSGCYDDGYGYGGVSAGYGAGGYYDQGYGGDYYGGYGGGYGGYGYAGYGWFGGFYYPGTGYYVYDRGGRRHRWNDQQRAHWEHRGDGRPGGGGRSGYAGNHGQNRVYQGDRGGRNGFRGRNGYVRGQQGQQAAAGVPDAAVQQQRDGFRQRYQQQRAAPQQGTFRTPQGMRAGNPGGGGGRTFHGRGGGRHQ